MAEKREVNLNKNDDICVTTHNDLLDFLAVFGELKTASYKLLYFALSQVLITDKKFYKYELSLSDFVAVTGGSKTTIKNYFKTKDGVCEAERISNELMNLKITLRNDTEHKKIHVFDYIQYDTKKKTFGWLIGPSMQHYLLNLKKRGNYMHPLFSDFAQLHSVRAMQLWHIMQSHNYMNSKKPNSTNIYEFEISDSQLREWTNTHKILLRRNNFRDRVILRPVKEISDILSLSIDVKATETGHKFSVRSQFYVAPDKIKSITQKYPGIQKYNGV